MTKIKLMSQRLVRGTPVVIADSFGTPHLRGAKQVVASKGPVKCNKGGRCAGDWCIGQAVFLTDPNTKNDDKDMGWRSGTTKVCLTHVRDEEGNLVLPPPAMRVAQTALERTKVDVTKVESTGPVSWEELAEVSSKRDVLAMTLLARRLKRENEDLQQKVINLQQKVIDQLTVG